jgi:predicted esterase
VKAFFIYFTLMTEHTVQFSFKARYYKSAEITSETKQIWFVLHGYGQLAQYFLKKFKSLPDNVVIIAPEGLSRFYLDEFQVGGRKSDRVGATWMTRENRKADIENYLQYLNSVYQKEVTRGDIPVTILGFSQGAATATRWILHNKINFYRLILWAGILPSDMDFEMGSKLLHGKTIDVVYGSKDPFLTDARFNEMKTLVQKLKTEIREIIFDGGHEIDEATLSKLI